MPLDANWILFIVTFALSLGLTPLFRKIALRSNYMDSPVGQLKKHTAPVPYLGGLAIYFSFLLGILGVLTAVEEMPINSAASRLSATARMALPVRVR